MKNYTLKINPKNNQRVLVLSDIHGNIELFHKILKSLQFTKEDILIINGDVSEKGIHSIEIFYEIMALQENHQVYMTLGNCDNLINHFSDSSKNEGMERYMNSRPLTFLNELRQEYNSNAGYLELVDYAQKQHQKLLNFIAQLPVIIEAPHFVCVHAALLPNGSQDLKENITKPWFLKDDVVFDKPVIVGHFPCCLYSQTYMCHNVIFNYNKNIIATDGGNSIKDEGQMNVIEIINDQFTAYAFDLLDYIDAPYPQKRVDRLHIHWFELEIELLEIGEEYSLIHHLESLEELWVYNEFIDFKTESLNRDYTNSLVEVKMSDKIHIIYETTKAYYIKCNGYVGWLNKKHHS